jgi:phytanoyl-CoA hydroxylase
MFEIRSPSGENVRIPESPAEDREYFTHLDLDAQRYLDEEGYVVLRGLIDRKECSAIRRCFAEEVKPYSGFLYRQTTARAERNQVNDLGHVMNPVLNLQDLDPEQFRGLRQRTLDLFTSRAVVNCLSARFNEPPKLVQSMYFEGNSETWAHQDTYYLDSEDIGTMVAIWIALEDIHPGAGRFYVYPRSHLIDIEKNGGDFNIAFNHDRYKALIVDLVRSKGLELRAPALQAGDVLLWNAKTIHGSLGTHRTSHSRQSLTAHFIPQSHRFLQWQSRIKPLNLRWHNGVAIHCPKDQSRLGNRMTLFVESRLPGPFYFAKRLVARAATG